MADVTVAVKGMPGAPRGGGISGESSRMGSQPNEELAKAWSGPRAE